MIAKSSTAAIARSAVASGLRTLGTEIAGMEILRDALARPPLSLAFDQAASLIVGCSGRVIVSGMGKSGIIGRKIAATLASTGTPAFFIHPAEASHGDLGMIARQDIVIAVSWSGETAELSDIIDYCRRFGVKLLAMTSSSTSTLATRSDIMLLLPQVREACPNLLAPTSSTMLQAALGDALAVALIDVRGFSAEDFRIFHPRGRLGAQLMRVRDLMGSGGAIPTVGEDASILAAMLEMSLKRFGITAIVDGTNRLVGALSDGDLRRGLTIATIDAPVRDHMTPSPLQITADMLASEALALMNARNIMQLFVTDGPRLVGIVHLHDILRAGVV